MTLECCEVDIESFLSTQNPVVGISEPKTDVQKVKVAELKKKWATREAALTAWPKKATTWRKFVDYRAVDSKYQSRQGSDGKTVFETEWQSFRVRKNKDADSELHREFEYDEPGSYLLAARVTDVFGNDGIATVQVKVK